ncbi:MAG TPA: S41 family peptidase [Stellaceae bacterium]|nr:S41 family peptidase [Stellaceae bacterium]
MRKLAIVVLAAVCALPGVGLAQQQSGNDAVYDELNLFDQAFERIRQDAVDPVSDRKLIDAAITGMLAGLDPHAAYIDPAAYQAMHGPAASNEAGIGVVVTLDNGELRVISPRDGSPAAEAGIRPGDLIFAIGKVPTYELTLAEAEKKLRGPAGSTVKLTLQRGESDKPIKLTLTRATAHLETVTSQVKDGNLGYVRIAGFDDDTPAALAAAVQDLRQRTAGKLAGVIVDLRNNPGGSFADAVAVADGFLDKGEVAQVKGRKPDSVKHIAAVPHDLVKGLPIVALVNGGTAGEAELVAGALQDNQRALLLGTKTYGDSDIETVIPLAGGGAIRLTTTRFTTPDGRDIEGKGITPDITVTPLKIEKLAQEEGIHEADLPGALKNPDQPAPAVPGSPASPSPAAGVGKSAPAATPAVTNATRAKRAPSVATGEIGGANDEQLIQALDILRGLSVYDRRAAG